MATIGIGGTLTPAPSPGPSESGIASGSAASEHPGVARDQPDEDLTRATASNGTVHQSMQQDGDSDSDSPDSDHIDDDAETFPVPTAVLTPAASISSTRDSIIGTVANKPIRSKRGHTSSAGGPSSPRKGVRAIEPIVRHGWPEGKGGGKFEDAMTENAEKKLLDQGYPRDFGDPFLE